MGIELVQGSSKDAELNQTRYQATGLQTLAKMYEAWCRGKEHYNICKENSLMSTQAALPEIRITVDFYRDAAR